MGVNKIILGSGHLYAMEFEGTIPETSAICTEENRLGYISGGCVLEYKPTYYDAKDDLGFVMKSIITEEEAMLKAGVMTLNGDTLTKLCETGRVSESDGVKTVLIGGVNNKNGKKYVVCFHYSDPADGDIWLMIVGQNQAGFSMAFAKDKETVIDAEFKALPHIDEQGTLIKYIEKSKA